MNNHILIPKSLVEDKNIKPNDLAVFVVLSYFAGPDANTCCPSYNAIASKAKTSKNTAIRAVHTLAKQGFLKITNRLSAQGTNDTNLFTIKYPIKGEK